MRQRSRHWYGIHKWSSLVCTLFLLMLCLTGLPLIFSEEIRAWLNGPAPYEQVAPDTRLADLDTIVRQAQEIVPGQIVTAISIDDDQPQTVVSLAPSWQASQADKSSNRRLRFDSRTGKFLGDFNAASRQSGDLLGVLLRLHMDLFSRLPGQFLLAAMGVLGIVATISGVVLYAPFTQKIDFGSIRRHRSARTAWLDLHNLLGIATIAWMLVVGFTGTLNELATPLFTLWQRTDVNDMLKPWRGRAPLLQKELGSVQLALDAAKAALPGMTVVSIAYPGGAFGSPHHFLIWAKGDSPITSRLFTPVLIDARSAKLSTVIAMPWYLRALELARPLHFGDYGGLPLKLIWCAFDLAALAILGSGLYLWLSRYRTKLAGSRK